MGADELHSVLSVVGADALALFCYLLLSSLTPLCFFQRRNRSEPLALQVSSKEAGKAAAEPEVGVHLHQRLGEASVECLC